MKVRIQEQLGELHGVKASADFRKRIMHLTPSLSSKYKGFNLRLRAFQSGLALLFVGIVTSMGSGILLAANNAYPGSILFPLKKAVIEAQVKLTKDNNVKQELLLRLNPSPTTMPTLIPPSPTQPERKHQNVEGVQTHHFKYEPTPFFDQKYDQSPHHHEQSNIDDSFPSVHEGSQND